MCSWVAHTGRDGFPAKMMPQHSLKGILLEDSTDQKDAKEA